MTDLMSRISAQDMASGGVCGLSIHLKWPKTTVTSQRQSTLTPSRRCCIHCRALSKTSSAEPHRSNTWYGTDVIRRTNENISGKPSSDDLNVGWGPETAQDEVWVCGHSCGTCRKTCSALQSLFISRPVMGRWPGFEGSVAGRSTPLPCNAHAGELYSDRPQDGERA
ncbi:hypothetical protein OH77DRAFT_1243628 [Trametes cingulata]|nr:hypothetical protein OH77DRAFT_1243628 [Trametes cingulata]